MIYKFEEFFAHCVYLLVRFYHACFILYRSYFPREHLTSVRIENLTESIQIHTYRLHDGHTEHVKKTVLYDGNGPTYTIEAIFNDKALPPWWYIGAELEDGSKLDMTEDMHPFIVSGNTITPTLLRALVPAELNPLGFTYIHPTTFEETPINSTGITVENESPHED